MNPFKDPELSARYAQVEGLAERDLFSAWRAVGSRLALETPNEFERMFGLCVERFREAPKDVREASLRNWDLLGVNLLRANAEGRRFASALIVEATAQLGPTGFETVAMNGSPHLRGLTYLRLARLVERIVIDAEAFVRDDPEADAFFVELEGDAAAELLGLTETHYDLVVLAFGMSLTEWGLAHRSVERVEIRFGEKSLGIRVGGREN